MLVAGDNMAIVLVVTIVLVAGEKTLLRGACQLAITLLADVAGESQFKVLIPKAQAQVAGCRLVLVDIIEPASTNGAGVAI